MKRMFSGLLLASLCAAQTPSADVLKQVLEKRLLSLKPEGTTERQVRFQDVRPLPKNGAYYPFQVTAVVRDYGPGYPANRFYGDTCVGQMDRWIFNLGRNPAGEWQVDGRMTIGLDATQCKKNPSAGVSSIPLATLTGTAAPRGTVAGGAPASGPGELHIGEWACYGTGSRLLQGLAFHLQQNGSYLDGDKKASGRWALRNGTIVFQGGHLDGQVGKNLKANSFDMSATVSCEPWR